MPTLGVWVLNSLPSGDDLAGSAAWAAGSLSPGRKDAGQGRDGTPASVRLASCDIRWQGTDQPWPAQLNTLPLSSAQSLHCLSSLAGSVHIRPLLPM